MAKYSSKDVILLIDGYNVLSNTTTVNSNVEALTEETTGFGDEWAEHTYLGLQKAELSQEGFFDDAAANVNDALNEKQGTDRIYCLGFEGNTIGKNFNGFEGALETKFDRIASRGAIHKANASYLGNGTVEDGKILHALTARTAAGNTQASSVDNGAASADGGNAYLQVTELTLGGYTNVLITVRQSADNVVWEDLQVFVGATLPQTAQRIEVAGVVKRYLAVSYALTGAGVGPSITFFVGFARN